MIRDAMPSLAVGLLTLKPIMSMLVVSFFGRMLPFRPCPQMLFTSIPKS
jgi:hypothetical protein